MTTRANSLTARVTGRSGATASPMTLPAHDLRVLLDGLGLLGYSVDALLAAARLNRADLTNPDAQNFLFDNIKGFLFGEAQPLEAEIDTTKEGTVKW